MLDPRLGYNQRLTARLREFESIRARYNLIARSRLVVFLSVVGLVVGIWRWHFGSFGWIGIGAAAIVFFLLVIIHSRLARRRALTEAAIAWCRRGLERLDGHWPDFPTRGESFLDDDHPYALDLDIFGPNSLFQFLNDGRTPFGERALASWLSQAAPPSQVRARQQAVQEVAGLGELREAIFVAGTSSAQRLSDPDQLLRWAGLPPSPRPQPWLVAFRWLSPTLFVGLLIFAGMGYSLGIPIILTFCINALALYLLRDKLAPTIDAISQRAEELGRYGEIFQIAERASVQSPLLKELQSRLATSGAQASVEIARLSRLVSMLDARQNGAFRALIGPPLLWDLHWVHAIQSWQRTTGTAVVAWLQALGELEALCSFGAFSFEHPNYAFPEIADSPLRFEAIGLGHPLLDDDRRVVNDLTLSGPGSVLLVTGSNMSGKSTLLRAIGVSAVLAMAGAPVCATSLSIGPCMVATSMRVSESLRDGVSRFYAELLKLKRVVEIARSKAPLLFLLDEILHGTNSRERHIGARSILRTLHDHRAAGAVSTHDLALADLQNTLPGHVRNVHFEEQVVNGTMTFDYKLREGVVRSGNALRWMRQVGLEVEQD